MAGEFIKLVQFSLQNVLLMRDIPARTIQKFVSKLCFGKSHLFIYNFNIFIALFQVWMYATAEFSRRRKIRRVICFR